MLVPHPLFATTDMLADVAALLKLTVTVAEPCPVLIEAPDVAVHV